MKKKNITTILFLFLIIAGFGFVAHAQVAHAQTAGQNDKIVNVDFPCPGCKTGTTDIVTYINNLYKFSLWIGGALALGMIVAGGIMRIVSAGSPDKLREASDMITSSIFGLILLFGSYLVLNTINPQITLLKFPAAGEGDAKLSPQTTDSLTASDCVSSSTQTFETIKVWDGKYQRSDLSCLYRRSVTPSAIGIVEGDYYASNPTIPKGSMVWLYPYFKKQGETSTAECLIYAYLAPKDSNNTKPEIQMVDLNSNLQLCVPKMQSLDSPTCKTWEFRAKNADTGTPVLMAIDTSTSTGGFNYFDISNPPPLESVNAGPIGALGTLLTKIKYYCIGKDGKTDKNNVCEQDGNNPFWRCTISENPKINMPSNNVDVQACAGTDASRPCETVVSAGFAVNSKPCDKTINNSSLNATGECKLNPDLITKLKAFSKAMGGTSAWYITEAWPSTVHHMASCHAIGTCADIKLTTPASGNDPCGNVTKAMAALKAAGLGGSLNEYAGCNGKTYDTTTGDNIHVQW